MKPDSTCLIRSGVRATQHGPSTAASAPHLGAPEWTQLLSRLSGWKLCVLLAIRTPRLLRLLGQLRGSGRTYQCRQPHHWQQPLATGVLRHNTETPEITGEKCRGSRSPLCDLGSVIAVTLMKITLA